MIGVCGVRFVGAARWFLPSAVCLAIGSGAVAGTTSNYAAGVEFDCTIRFNPPLSRYKVALFERCWVSSNYYRIAIVWSEPHDARIWFPTYPPTLSIGSDSKRFTISHDV